MPATWTKYTLLPCYLHLSIYDDECAAENSIRFPDTLHLDHPSLEQISIKRVKSVEKGCVFPSMGLIFIRGQLFEKHIENLGKTNHGENSGTFECVQMIRQQADAPKCRKNITRQGISDDGKLLYSNGYLIFAYKTMEDMCTKDFAASWKTWTGARQLCQLLPDKYMVKRFSHLKACLRIIAALFVLSVSSMWMAIAKGVWVRKKPPRKVGCVMFENKFPFPTKEPEVPEKSPEFDRRDAIERLIVDLVTDPKDEDKSAKEVIKSPRRAHSEARTNVERRKLNVPDDDSLLQRLKLNYFNSPDYTSAELREINSD
ncbi:hypothetical protein V3C99_017564 [Haemonchus contortus]|uniref:Sushi domain-containing protein n=1 Tax=Haemonchus contortus TaxID=6289 RepID=A0A7I5EET7_HAECO